jgi:hypothetical protein
MNWKAVYKISIAWLFIVAAILLYNTYLMWFTDTHLGWLQPDYQLKIKILVVPALALFYFARFKIRRAAAYQHEQ